MFFFSDPAFVVAYPVFWHIGSMKHEASWDSILSSNPGYSWQVHRDPKPAYCLGGTRAGPEKKKKNILNCFFYRSICCIYMINYTIQIKSRFSLRKICNLDTWLFIEIYCFRSIYLKYNFPQKRRGKLGGWSFDVKPEDLSSLDIFGLFVEVRCFKGAGDLKGVAVFL